MLVEFGESEDSIDDVGGIIHDDDCSGTETTSQVFKIVEVHQGFTALLFGEHWDGGSTWNDGFEVVPTADDTPAMSIDELSEGDTHFLLDSAWVVNVTTNAEKLSAGISLPTKAVEPAGASSHDGGAHSNGLDVGNSCWATVESCVSWKWGLQSRTTGLALEGLDESRFLSTNISTGSSVGIDIKVVATTASILSKEALVICFFDCSFELESLVPKLTSAIDIGSLGSHSEPADEGTLDKLMWVKSEDLSIFTGTWLRFIGVDDEI